jgi:hypothetical protein
MHWLLLLLAVYSASSLECYVDYGETATCESLDSSDPQCALVYTLQGTVESACRSVIVCEFYAELMDEGVIEDYECCGEDGCNDPGIAPPSTPPGTSNSTDPNDPVYRCSSFDIWPAWEGTAEECVSQYDGDECVYCAVQNGNVIFQTCSPRFNYTCWEIENSEEVTTGYCNAGYACPAGTIIPSTMLITALGIVLSLLSQ